jgi:hypothetical protein
MKDDAILAHIEPVILLPRSTSPTPSAARGLRSMRPARRATRNWTSRALGGAHGTRQG